MLSSVTLYGNRALVSHAIKRRHLNPQRNKNIIQRAPTGTLPCKQNSNSSGMLQSCSKSVQVSLLQELLTPLLWQPDTAGDSGHCSWSQMMASSLSHVGEDRQLRTKSPNLSQHGEEQGKDGALSTLLQVFSVWGCSQGQLVACLHSRVFISWSYSVKLERRLIAGVGANELWWRLKTYGD